MMAPYCVCVFYFSRGGKRHGVLDTQTFNPTVNGHAECDIRARKIKETLAMKWEPDWTRRNQPLRRRFGLPLRGPIRVVTALVTPVTAE